MTHASSSFLISLEISNALTAISLDMALKEGDTSCNVSIIFLSHVVS